MKSRKVQKRPHPKEQAGTDHSTNSRHDLLSYSAVLSSTGEVNRRSAAREPALPGLSQKPGRFLNRCTGGRNSGGRVAELKQTENVHLKGRHTYLLLTSLLTLIIIMAASLYLSRTGGDLDPIAAKEQMEQKPGVIIDVRTPGEYESGHLAETEHLIDFLSGDFQKKIDELDRDQTYYLYCRSGNRSGKAMKKMLDAGFREVYNIGGYEDLVEAGLTSDK